MDNRYFAIAVLSVCVFIFILLDVGEPFATKDTKAQAIYDWFKSNPRPRYDTFRSDLNNGSNIVEYETVREIVASRPNFTVGDVKAAI